MKKAKLFLLITALLSSCSFSRGTNNFKQLTEETTPSSFDLIGPTNNEVVSQIPTFSWNASAGAMFYTLEIASTSTFADIDSEVYYKAKDITDTSFTITSELSKKDINYYWKVTAVGYGAKHTTVCNNVFTFFYSAPFNKEVSLSIGEADDWVLHSAGSKANISIDDSNFFGNDKDSLVIQFNKEDTNQGIPSSDGWIIVTKTLEVDLFGPDSILFDFYYCGHSANVKIRFVDKTNEYWYAPVKISVNSKQKVLLKFSDFIQRLNDVPVTDRNFDYYHIKYMEIVFEQSFGDGVCVISDPKAVRAEDYKNWFIEKLDFSAFKDNLVFENHTFDVQTTDTEMTMSYKSINGYGFTKVVNECYFVQGDTISVDVKYSGGKGTNVILRIYEQDTDRWAYKIPFNSLSTTDYVHFDIPYEAFSKSQILGDGARQFYYVINIQFGLEGLYGSGSLSFKDFTITSKSVVGKAKDLIVDQSGFFDDFESYQSTADLYFDWSLSTSNKDEFISINTAKSNGEGKQCLEMHYKSDMGPAYYTRGFTFEDSYKPTAIKISFKDESKHPNGTTKVYATAGICLTLHSGEQYVYYIPNIAKLWTEYVIPLSLLTLNPGTGSTALKHEHVRYFTVGVQYYYKDNKGVNSPLYQPDNIVYADDISFVDASDYSTGLLENVISADTTNKKLAYVEDFEYTQAEMEKMWKISSSNGYEDFKVDTDVSKNGGAYSGAFYYKGNYSASPVYTYNLQVDDTVTAKGITFDLKGDGHAKIMINMYLNIGGTLAKFRYTLEDASTSWCHYEIGFGSANFELLEGNGVFNANNLKNIEKITIGITSGDNIAQSHINIDNIIFSGEITSYSRNNVTEIN